MNTPNVPAAGEQESINSTPQDNSSPSQKFNKKIIIILLIGFISILIFIPLAAYFLKNNGSSSQTKSQVNKTTIIKPVFNQIQSRSEVAKLKNIGGNGAYASGFVNPELFTKKQVSQSFFTAEAYAQENSEHPFIFYTDGKKVIAYDVAALEVYDVFSLSDVPKILNTEKAILNFVYFVNSSKKLIFFMQECINSQDCIEAVRNNTRKDKSSINSYDLETKQFEEIASVIAGGGSPASWSNIAISPDENYLFAFYNNAEEDDPFADVYPPPNADPYADTTYFMFNLKTKDLKRFKLQYRLAGAGLVRSSWVQDSSAVLLGYSWPINPNPSMFILIDKDGKSQALSDNVPGPKSFEQVSYNKADGNIYYIGSDSLRINESKFGYFDVNKKTFNKITPENLNSLNFIYDFGKGYIYDSYQRVIYSANSEGITGRKLNYYDLQSKSSKELSAHDLAFVNFNGDYRHLLVGSTVKEDLDGAKIYDLDLQTGNLVFLNKAPFVFSVYGSRIHPASARKPSPSIPTASENPTATPPATPAATQ